MTDGTIIECQFLPLPNPRIQLHLITYLSKEFKIKGLLVEPIVVEDYDGFFIF
ncbi:hypothetical protein [Metabacillus idriensis]|uniref:hypothetical protein n=1 Tax=Metabacillus idriensis TaxID=324768 RepID=UPI00174C435C|nr:hypothetical protein [Metabacillus idriensis]